MDGIVRLNHPAVRERRSPVASRRAMARRSELEGQSPMIDQAVPLVLLLFLSAAVATAVGLRGWSYRPTPGAVPLTLLMVGLAVWAATYGLEIGSVTLPTILFWDNMTFFGIVLIPTAWLALALQYTGRAGLLTRRAWVLLSLEPLLALLLVWTDRYHHLFWATNRLDTRGAFPVIDQTYGFGFIAHTAYSYLLLLLGWLLFLEVFVRGPPIYRPQIGAVLISALLPWLANIITLRGAVMPAFDLTPFAFALAGPIMAVTLFRFQLFELVPVAWGTVVERMSDAVIVLDAQHCILNLNPMAQRLLDRAPADVLGQPIGRAFAPLAELLGRSAGPIDSGEEIGLGEGAATRIFDLRIAPLHTRARVRHGWLLVLRDITERKQVEPALAQAKAAAEQANQAKTTFLANMSHELRTPLTAIMGYSDLLQKLLPTRGAEDLVPDVARINMAGGHLLALINDLLDLTKIEAGKIQLYREQIAIGPVVEDAVRISRPLIDRNGNTLQVQCDDDLDAIYTDRMRLQQILLNLLSNAAKFTERGTITFSIVREQVDGAAWAQFRVADTGIGIASDQLPRLFQPFTQVDAAIAQKYGGTGLGLALSQRFCQMLGGYVTAESELGKGSAFTVHLPMSDVDRSARALNGDGAPAPDRLPEPIAR